MLQADEEKARRSAHGGGLKKKLAQAPGPLRTLILGVAFPFSPGTLISKPPELGKRMFLKRKIMGSQALD